MVGSRACSLGKGNRSLQGSYAQAVVDCATCSPMSRSLPPQTLHNDELAGILEETLIALLRVSQAQKSRKAKVGAMIAIKRVSAHTINQSTICNSASTLGQWCLKALQSSARQLRIAARCVSRFCLLHLIDLLMKR